MLGAEGVKSLVIDRLIESVPTAITAVAHRVGASEGEIPAPTGYYPSKVPAADVPTGGYPFVTVNALDTDGEITSEILTAGEIVEQFQLGYNVAIVIYTQVSGQGGEPLARLQAERLALALREALLWERQLAPADSDESAEINFARWAEDYDTTYADDTGSWLGWASLIVPITTVESLDRAPHLDTAVMLVGHEVYAADPITGVPYPETVEDGVDGYQEP